MSPLLIVGIVCLSSVLADVSHVLQGSARPPELASDVNQLAVPRSDVQDGASGDYWWMASDSPLKEAYDYYKKCTSKGNCSPPVSVVANGAAKDSLGVIDIKSNPFLNGDYKSGSVSFSPAKTSLAGGQEEAQGLHSEVNIDISKNPFLNPQYVAGNGETVEDANGFLGVQPKKPGFATTHPISNKKPFGTSHPLSERVLCTGQNKICVAKGICVNGVVSDKSKLIQVRIKDDYCNDDIEQCCTLASDSENIVLPNVEGKTYYPANINELLTAGKSSVHGSTFKFEGRPGSSAGQIQVLLGEHPEDKTQLFHASEIGSQINSISSTAKPIRDASASVSSAFGATPDYSNVEFGSDARYGSTFKGPDYLPPFVGTTPPISTYVPSIPTPKPCPSGTYPDVSGNCISICPPGTLKQQDGSCQRPPTPILPCPFGSIGQPDGSCKRPETPSTCSPGTYPTGLGTCSSPTTPVPSCQFGTFRQPDGSCKEFVPSSTPRPCPPGTFLTAGGICSSPSTSRPTCSIGLIQKPDGSCERPTTPPSYSKQCFPGTYLTESGECKPIKHQEQPCTLGSIKQPDGSCKPFSPDLTPRPCPQGSFSTSYGSCETPITPVPSCPFGTIKGPGGLCEKLCPIGSLKKPDGNCESPSGPSTLRPSCPPGTFLGPYGSCEKPTIPTTTSGYEYPSPCPPGTIKNPSGSCETPTSPRPSCSFGTYLTPAGNCVPLPSPSTPRPSQITTSKEYFPSVTPTKPTTTPKPTCRPGQVILSSGRCEYPTKPSTPGYLPPENQGSGSNIIDSVRYPDGPDNTFEPANTNSVFVPTTRPTYQSTTGEQNVAPPVGCPAALKCVQEIYCTAEGFISPVPVVLSKEQELLRAPTTVCRDIETGIIGKCCRDANYKDAWPSANLVNGVDDGQYKEDNFYGQHELLDKGGNRLRRNSTLFPNRPARRIGESYQPPSQVPENTCGEKNFNTKPRGEGPIDANFAEYPWQAMILRDSNRSLLCGGAIIQKDAVLTSAHCVEGLETSDVLIKGGEWKLGIDEEPLPFQIVKVAAIIRHPEYKVGSYYNDLALLVLQEKLRLTKNVGTICLPAANQIPTENCKVTGWGKRILQLHAKGALMHHIDAKVVDSQQCQATLTERFQEYAANYSPSQLCCVSEVDQCRVDYGSALACANSQGQYFLSGIYTWDTGCRQAGQIGGYVIPDVQWIDSVISRPLKELRRIDREYLLKSRN